MQKIEMGMDRYIGAAKLVILGTFLLIVPENTEFFRE